MLEIVLNPAAPSILVIKPSSLGDVVHTLPAVARLKRAWPASRIRWLVNTEWLPLLEGNPHIERTIEFPRQQFRGLLGGLKIVPWARGLHRCGAADLVLDFQGLLRSALLARLCRGKATRVLGFADAREGARFSYDEAVDVAGTEHAVDRYLALARHAIGAAPAFSEPDLEWPLPPGTAVNGVDDSPFILLHPFARGGGKSLSVAEVVAFCDGVAPQQVVVAGRTEMRLPPIANARDLLNRTTLHELVWLLRRAAFVVSVDSGPMHMAAALTPHLVAIHTWSDPRKVGPYRGDAWILAQGQLFQRAQGPPGLAMPDLGALAGWIRGRVSP
jgi:ADP-heptose:LPS heptosyltransferase